MHAIVIHENVTALKLQEQKIQFCHQRFHDVASAADEYIWEIDPAGNFTYLSEMITPITGYTPEELLGACVFDLMPPEESRKTCAAHLKLAEERAGFRNRIDRIKTFDLIDQALTGITADSFSTIGIFSVEIDFFNTINESLGHRMLAGRCSRSGHAQRPGNPHDCSPTYPFLLAVTAPFFADCLQ